MKKMLFVMNPYAGKRQAAKVLAEILAEFCAAGYEVSVHMTAGPDDGRQVVAQRASQMDLVVCCGGDGTFNEAVAGIMQCGADTPIGYIPAGSTNDFAASLGLATDPIQAAKAIIAGTPEAYDLCNFGGRYFTYVASFGAFTGTSYNTSQSFKNKFGHGAYVLSGMKELTHIHSIPVSVEVEGERIEGPFIFGAISNSTSLGGVLKLDPKRVDMQDGQFEIMLVRKPKNPAQLVSCISALKKGNYDHPMLAFRSAKQAKVFMEDQLPWTLDGEKELGRPEVEVENIHLAFRLVK